jgi:hypothetical protein
MKLKFGIFLCVFLGLSAHLSEAKTKKKSLQPLSTSKLDPAAQESVKAAMAQALEEQPGYVATLGELDAEMQVALALYQTSSVTVAKNHLSHSDAVVYRRLLHRVLARRATGFSTELNAFTKAIETGEKYKFVKAKYTALQKAIADSRGKGDLLKALPMVTAVSLLMHKSADYFNSGVANGEVIEPSQYQDAWGFMKASKSIMADISKGERTKYSAELKEVDAALADLNSNWPSLTAGETNSDGPQILSEAVAKLDAVLLKLN